MTGTAESSSAGRSRPWHERPEPTSGLSLHQLEFTGLGATGEGFHLEAAGRRSHPFRVSADLYRTLSADALRFFTLMRSGTAILADEHPGYARPGGHLGQPPNRGDTAVRAWAGPDAERLYPGWTCEGSFDVSGGWYDAGDYGKYTTSGSVAVWQLLTTLDLVRSVGTAPPTQVTALLAECRWELDWLLRMQVPSGYPLSGMAFHRVHGTDVVTVARLGPRGPDRARAAPSLDQRRRCTWSRSPPRAHGCSVATTPEYAERLLGAARLAYAAAERHPPLVAPDDHALFGGGPYDDDELGDDVYWAAAELWLATGEDAYRNRVLASPHHRDHAFDPAGHDFDRVAALRGSTWP